MWNAILFICYAFFCISTIAYTYVNQSHSIYSSFFSTFALGNESEKNRAESVLHLPVQHKKAINMLQLRKL